MGLNSKSEKRSADVSLLEDVDNEERPNKRLKPMECKGGLNAIIADEWKTSSGPPSPVPFLSPDGRVTKPAEIFRTDLISAMKLPDTQTLNPENYMTIIDPWRQEWERGVQVPVHPEGFSQPSFSLVETYHKKTSTFKLSGKLLNSEEKRKGKSPCNYDLNRIDVEWLFNLNKLRRNKGRIELEEEALEKAISYLEDKCYENMGYAIATQKGLSIEYDENVCCEVCQSPDSEEGNEMVFCDSCDICMHQACYGIQNIPSGSWLCRPCRRGITKPTCQLCPNTGGAMKQTKKGKNWVHVSCALWVPEVGFGSVERMEPIIKLENIPANRWNLVCFLCREKRGACIQCTVKTCMTAFHVSCGFQHGLEMKTVLDETAVDGVRHLCYCAKHGYKNKSPPRSPEKTKQDAEEAENLRQKRLKQMETEFYKYVDVSEMAKDLNVPKELASHIHSFWTLKRKARDDLPLLPPSLEQQEKLCGKQGVASRSLQIQIEELMRMRCDLERLRNLCYMVSKREKLRRELFRVREQLFWKAHDVMTDDTIDVDDDDLKWVREACGKNYTGDGSEPSRGPTAENTFEPVCSSGAQSSNSGQTSPDDVIGETSQSNEPSECSEGEVRGGYDSSDSEDSPRVKTRHRLRGFSSHKSRRHVVNRLKSNSQDPQTSREVNKSRGAREATDNDEKVDEGDGRNKGFDTPKRSRRTHCQRDVSVERNSSVDSFDDTSSKSKENSEEETAQVVTRRRQRCKPVAIDRNSTKAETSNRIGLTRPRTRGQTSDSTSEDIESTRVDEGLPPSPSRSLRSSKQVKLESDDRTRRSPTISRSKSVEDFTVELSFDLPRETRNTRSRQTSSSKSVEGFTDDLSSDLPRETRSTRSRQTSSSTGGEQEILFKATEYNNERVHLTSCAESLKATVKGGTLKENKILRENCVRRSRNRTVSLNEGKMMNEVLPTKRQKIETPRRAKGRNVRGSRSLLEESSDSCQSTNSDFFFKGSPRRNVSRKSSEGKIQNGYDSPRTTESENSKSDEENADNRVQRLSSLRSFSTGREASLPPSPCPKCQIQQEHHNGRMSPESKTRSPERKNKELRPRNMQLPRSRNVQSPRSRNTQSPRSRSRLLSSLRYSPTRSCGSIITQVCRATTVL